MSRHVVAEVSHRRPPFDFLVRVQRGTEGSSGFCGTGFLVSPRHVITCAHLVLGRMPAEADTGDALVDPGDILVRHVDEFTRFRRGTLIGVALPDAALIAIEEPVAAKPVGFIANVRAEHERAIEEERPLAIGFSDSYPEIPVES